MSCPFESVREVEGGYQCGTCGKPVRPMTLPDSQPGWFHPEPLELPKALLYYLDYRIPEDRHE